MPSPPSVRDAVAFRAAVLRWYDAQGRSLPFRASRDPYAILVSESMAQQTQVSRVGEAWARFIDRFPTVEALAASRPIDVLRAWRGLGYNRRALALRQAAIGMVERHGGRVPSDIPALGGLPGVGPYTARAVAAIAFGLPVGAVDTNVRRVLGRVVFGDAAGAGVPAPNRLAQARELQAVADALVPADRAGDWTHALMDIGATLCRPTDPSCDTCPARPSCRFAAAGRTGGAEVARPSADRIPAASPPFATTSRWLRGRILDLLRDSADGEWQRLDGDLGTHGTAAVAAALSRLAREGLTELHPTDPLRARLPLS